MTFLFIEQSRLSLSLSSLPLLSTPPLNLPFLPSSTDGFTLSPSLPPIFFHPLLQFARSAPIYSLIFVLSSLLFLSSKLSILLYECLSSYSSLFQVNVQRVDSVLLARWSIILIICFKEIHFQSHFRKVNKSAFHRCLIKRFARKEGERRKPRTFLSKNDRMKRIRFRTKSRLQDNRCRLFLLISRQLRHIRAARVCVDDAPWKRPALINEAFRWTWVYFRFGVYALGIRGKRVIAWNKII